MKKHCYYCGKSPAPRPVQISATFTAGGLVKAPHSDAMCDRCYSIMIGDIQRVWYHNIEEQRYTPLFLRGIHQLWQGETLVVPMLLPMEERTPVTAAGKSGKPLKLHALTHIPKRIEIREWLSNPPEPPFTIAIAETGQKHILFLAQEAYSRDVFPVQFEMDSLQIDRVFFLEILKVYERLLALSFSKTEIDSGDYRPDRILANLEQWQSLEAIVSQNRSGGKPTRFLQLVSFVAQRPEIPPEISSKPAQLKNEAKEPQTQDQLSFF